MNCIKAQSADGKCQISIDNIGPNAVASWFDVWLAIENVVAVCVRAGKGGDAIVRSKYSTFFQT